MTPAGISLCARKKRLGIEDSTACRRKYRHAELVMTVVADECRQAVELDDELVIQWRDHRDALPPLESLVR